MYKRLLIAALLAGSVLVAGAMPAFTADNGTVVGTVSVPVPPAPCFTLDGSAVDFGTLPFSDPAATATPFHTAAPAVRVTSCSAGAERITGAASNATFAGGGSWEAMDDNPSNTCDAASGGGVDRYKPGWNIPGASGRLYNPRADGSFAPQPGFQLEAGAGGDVTYHLQMPCRGSVGAGDTASMTFYLLAVLV